MGELGNYYIRQYEYDNRDVIAALRAEEANLLRARALARQNGWHRRIISAMQGLRTLYAHTGRRAEWKRLVDEITPDFIGIDDLPLVGREDEWDLVTEYRMHLTREARDWVAAERIQRLRVDVARRKATPLLARPPESLDAGEKNTLRTLAVSIEQLGHIQREQGKPECTDVYQEAMPFCQKIGDKAEEAVLALNLGHAYKNLPALCNLDEAERWYKEALKLFAEVKSKNVAQTLGQLGLVAYKRFQDTRKEEKTQKTLARHLNTAADYYRQTLALLPPDAVDDLAVTHNQLGIIYKDAGDLERALEHYNQAAKFFETAGNLHHAGVTRFNVAIALANNGRPSDALLYARAALRNFEPYGQGAAEMIAETKELIGEIEHDSGL